MANYVFEELLSPLDFEHLIKDLLSKDLKIELSAFAEGKDDGIDLRYSKGVKNNTIVQCKRVKSIQKKQIDRELEKIKELNPNKYYFAISSEPSVKKIDYIKSVFGKWMKSDKNIYTKSRINKLLDENPAIHQHHYKLWINSSEIFSNIINKPLFQRAKSLINDLKNDYKYYVKNESLQKAIEILNKNQFIIISGIPGIGKTTLAKLILWEYLQKEYEIIEIRKVIEGEQLLEEDSDKKQVFYFDDFLGENFLKYDAIEGRSYDLIQLIKRIMKNKNKALIMTTREYILKQARDKYEKIDSDEFDIYKYTLDLNSYGKRIRALILYNHLFYSGISLEHIKNLINTKAYRKIINHKNYSPRIIEQMTIKLKDITAEEYPDEFIENLDNPFGIWNRAFHSQISEGSKYTLFLLLSIGEPILLEEFKNVTSRFFEINSSKYNLDFRAIDTQDYLRELEDSFIRLDMTNKGNHYINFQNPSIKDFMLSMAKDNKELIIMILESVVYFNQLSYTLNHLIDNINTDEEIISCLNNIIEHRFDEINANKWVFSGNEYAFKKSKMGKIKTINYFVRKTKNKKCRRLVIKQFKSLDISKLYRDDEKEYIKFANEYKKVLKPDTETLFNKVLANISWFDNVKNFNSLRKIDSEKYDSFLNKNEDKIKEKVESAIKKDIEFAGNIDSLDNLSEDLYSEEDNLIARFSLDLSYFESEINNKREVLEDEQENTEPEELEVKDIEESFVEEDFNEDEYFRLDMFN